MSMRARSPSWSRYRPPCANPAATSTGLAVRPEREAGGSTPGAAEPSYGHLSQRTAPHGSGDSAGRFTIAAGCRVIYARSFSKTLSGSLRVGFVACAQDIANQMADIKMLTSITTSQFTERLVYLMLVDGHYRKYLSRLHERLGEARLNVVRAFERMGLELFVEPADGMFVWARFPHIEDSLTLAEASQRDGIMLAPGAIFRPHLERSPWMRFNVTICEDTRVQRWLQRQTASKAA
jgi:DNA-binding transcriptional MocR family regulator